MLILLGAVCYSLFFNAHTRAFTQPVNLFLQQNDNWVSLFCKGLRLIAISGLEPQPFVLLRFGRLLLLSCLRTLGTVLTTTLSAVGHTGSIQCTAYNVITHTGQVLYTTAAHQYDTVLLQVVTLTGNVRVHFLLVCQTNTGNFTHCRIRLLRGCSVHTNTNTTALRTCVQRGRLALVYKILSAFSYQL